MPVTVDLAFDAVDPGSGRIVGHSSGWKWAAYEWRFHQIGIARLCSDLKHDFAWGVACSTALERFARAGKREHLG